MKALLSKEIKLASSIISWLFIAFAAMTMIPGYPILVGAFFLCLGLFHSFQNWRENNDILYTALLPVKKTDVVKAKFSFVILIQLLYLALCLILTVLRMTLLKNSGVYVTNVMMNANQFYLGCILLVFAVFNLVFICGFFRTAYKFSKPFIASGIAIFVVILLAEALHHIPGLEFLNGTDTAGDVRMWLILIACAAVYAALTLLARSRSMTLFEQIDL